MTCTGVKEYASIAEPLHEVQEQTISLLVLFIITAHACTNRGGCIWARQIGNSRYPVLRAPYTEGSVLTINLKGYPDDRLLKADHSHPTGFVATIYHLLLSNRTVKTCSNNSIRVL